MTAADEERAYYEQSRRVYPKFAPWYDAIVRPIRGLRRDVATLAGVTSGMRVLDVATGTGEQAIAFAKRGADVVAIDMSPAMLAIARTKIGAANVTLIEADATALPFPDASFDVVSTSFALHEMPPEVRARAVQELVRVARPGARVVVVDYALPHRPAWAAIVTRAVALYERDSYPEFVRSDLLALLTSSGLDVQSRRTAILGAVQIVVASRPAVDRRTAM